MPGADRVSLGAWEGGDFVGAIVFSRGATPNIGSPYDLKQTEICELTRVAFRDHEWPISRCLAIALKMLPKKCPRLRMVVSYADPYHDHHGGIYQATNWIFTGRTPAARFFKIGGDLVHPRTVGSRGIEQSIDAVRRHIDPNAEEVKKPGKFRYLYPLDDDMRKRVEPMSNPYPKPEDI